MAVSTKSKSWQLSKYDVKSWGEQASTVLISGVVWTLVQLLPQIQEITLNTFGENEIYSQIITFVFMLAWLLLRKFVKDYTKA